MTFRLVFKPWTARAGGAPARPTRLNRETLGDAKAAFERMVAVHPEVSWRCDIDEVDVRGDVVRLIGGDAHKGVVTWDDPTPPSPTSPK